MHGWHVRGDRGARRHFAEEALHHLAARLGGKHAGQRHHEIARGAKDRFPPLFPCCTLAAHANCTRRSEALGLWAFLAVLSSATRALPARGPCTKPTRRFVQALDAGEITAAACDPTQRLTAATVPWAVTSRAFCVVRQPPQPSASALFVFLVKLRREAGMADAKLSRDSADAVCKNTGGANLGRISAIAAETASTSSGYAWGGGTERPVQWSSFVFSGELRMCTVMNSARRSPALRMTHAPMARTHARGRRRNRCAAWKAVLSR